MRVRLATLLPLLALAACQQAPAPAVWPRTQDLGDVGVNCERGNMLIISLNSDDDDGNGRPDLQNSVPAAADNNLRKLIWGDRDTRTVKIDPPVGSRIRVWDVTRRVPFDFNSEHKATQGEPLEIWAEGVVAGRADMKYKFKHEDGRLCEATLDGFVIDGKIEKTAGGDTSRLNASRKLLLGGEATLKADLDPANPPVSFAWNYHAGTLATPAARETKLTAGSTPTRALDSELITLRLTSQRGSPQLIEVQEPLNLTAGSSVELQGAQPPPQRAVENWANGGNVNKTIELFNWVVPYRIRDQFDAPITDSARGGSIVQIKEEVPIQHLLPDQPPTFLDINQWVANARQNTSPDWKNPDTEGVIEDHVANYGQHGDITLVGLEIGYLLARSPANGLVRVHPALNRPGGVLGVNPHVWHLSVRTPGPNGTNEWDQSVTRNELVVDISAYTGSGFNDVGPETLDFRSTYRVVPP